MIYTKRLLVYKEGGYYYRLLKNTRNIVLYQYLDYTLYVVSYINGKLVNKKYKKLKNNIIEDKNSFHLVNLYPPILDCDKRNIDNLKIYTQEKDLISYFSYFGFRNNGAFYKVYVLPDKIITDYTKNFLPDVYKKNQSLRGTFSMFCSVDSLLKILCHDTEIKKL